MDDFLDRSRRTAAARAGFLLPILVLALAACGDGEPTLFSAPAALDPEGPVSIEGTVGEEAAPLPSFRVVDARGNPVPGVLVSFHVEAGGGSVQPTELRTDEDGRASPASWTLGETAGLNVLVADLASVGEVHVEAVAAPGPPSRITPASARLQTGAVANPVPDPPVARLEDRFGNPLEGFEIVFEPEEDSGEVEGASGTTGEDGQVALGSWTLGTRAGDQAVRARIADDENSPTFRFVAQAQAGQPVSMAAASPTFQEAEAGSRVDDPPGVLFLDQYDNPVPGVETAFTVVEGGGSVIGSPATSGASGVASVDDWYLGVDEGTNRVVASAEPFADVEFEVLATPMVLAHTIEGVHLNQGNQRLEGDIGGIAGRPGILRVVARANRSNDHDLDVLVRLYEGDALLREERLSRANAGVPTNPNLAFLSHTWNLPLAADEVVPGLRVEAVLDPDSTAIVASREGHYHPQGGGPAALDVRPMPPLRVVFFPVHLTLENRTGNVTPGNAEDFLNQTRRWIPVDQVLWEVRPPFTTDADLTETEGWTRLLQELQATRTAEEATDEYYHGIVPFFQGLRWGGFAYVNATPSGQARTGLTYDGLPAASGTLAHELGHNLGRLHSPCGNPAGVDDDYPHDEAEIGPPGYHIDTGFLIAGDYRDYMSYCGPRWTSDYTFEALLGWRRSDPWAQPTEGSLAWTHEPAVWAGAGAQPVAGGGARDARTTESGILVWGRVGSDGAVLAPAFALEARRSLPTEDGPHRVRGLAEDGRELFRLAFEGAHPAHAPDPAERHFSFFVPLSAADLRALDRIELDSPLGRAVRRTSREAPLQLPGTPGADARTVMVDRTELGEVRLRWEADRFPLAMLRDPDTGRVLGFARGGEWLALDREGRLERAEILLSDGVRSGPALRR